MQIAEAEARSNRPTDELPSKQAALTTVTMQLQTASRNLALAETPAQRQAIAAVFDELSKQQTKIAAEVQALQIMRQPPANPQAEVAAAMELVRRLSDLAADEANYAAIGLVFARVNARLFVRFKEVQYKKRKLNKVAGGVVTFGTAPPPIAIYDGPTGRKGLKAGSTKQGPAGVVAGPHGSESHPQPDPADPGRESDSFGNRSRGNKTPLELFLAGVRGWSTGLRRRMDDGKPFSE